MARLHAEVLTVDDITVQLRETMYRVYSRYFEATNRDRFDGDLAGKTHALLLYDETGELRGFSTIALYQYHDGETNCQVVFSGDTIVHHEFWGEQTLPMAWLELTGVFKAQQPEAPLYWFLIVKGYRTYRYLPLFAKDYYPNYRIATPAHLQAMLNHLARDRFGYCYDTESGVIHFDESLGHLAPEWADVPSGALKRPEVQYFLERNPGHVRGDELACITELTVENLRRRARSAFERGLQQC